MPVWIVGFRTVTGLVGYLLTKAALLVYQPDRNCRKYQGHAKPTKTAPLGLALCVHYRRSCSRRLRLLGLRVSRSAAAPLTQEPGRS